MLRRPGATFDYDADGRAGDSTSLALVATLAPAQPVESGAKLLHYISAIVYYLLQYAAPAQPVAHGAKLQLYYYTTALYTRVLPQLVGHGATPT